MASLPPTSSSSGPRGGQMLRAPGTHVDGLARRGTRDVSAADLHEQDPDGCETSGEGLEDRWGDPVQAAARLRDQAGPGQDEEGRDGDTGRETNQQPTRPRFGISSI